MPWSPSVERRRIGQFGVEVRLGHPLLDDYLRFVAARCRPNTVLATGFDLKVFFTFVGKDPLEVTTADVLDFITDQRAPRRGGNVVRIEDGESGLSARTVRRRMATLSGLFGYLVARGALPASPVPSGITTRTRGGRGGRRGTATPLNPCPVHVAAAALTAGGHRVVGRATHRPGCRDGRGDAAGWTASLRGARTAAGGRAPG